VPSQVRQLSYLACFLLVVLRVSIGWQFLYEGMWKFKQQRTSNPWSAEGYLRNARGPFRDNFRAMTGDPDSLDVLDYDKVAASWDAWYQRLLAFHPDLDDNQKRRIEELMNGPGSWSEPLAALPEGVQFRGGVARILKYDANAKRLVATDHILPAERDALIEQVEQEEKELSAQEKAFVTAINRLYDRTSKLSLKERLQVSLKEDPERAGVIQERHAGTIDHKRIGDIEMYKHLLERYEQNLKHATQDFHHEHLTKQWQELQELRSKLVGPVQALTQELQASAQKLLTVDQLSRGALPAAPSKIGQINQRVMYGLVVFGSLLMLGLFSRVAALGAATMLISFYLAMPPWPGVPPAPGPEHCLFIDKNLIEALVCLALAATPSGRWIGLDSLVRKYLFRRKTD
jgi:uncharacterized membrane protein YphA (DoxX/SURF4 family)